MTRALIAGSQPLYRLAVGELLERHEGVFWEESDDPFLPPGRGLDDFDLLVICGGNDDTELIRRLGDSPRLTSGKVVLFSDCLGKRHRALWGTGRIDLCLPLAIPLDQARKYLKDLLMLTGSQMALRLRDDLELRRRFHPDLNDLTRSERRVLFNLQRGLSNQGIADSMAIRLNTAKVHLARACRKAGFRNRCQAAGFLCARLAVDQGLIQG